LGTGLGFFLSLVVPLVVALGAGLTSATAFSISVTIPLLGMTWSWGLFCIAFWFAPEKGPANLEVLQRRHWIVWLYGRLFRYVAPAFLIVWFLSPFMVLGLFLLENK
jgi:hypothetical protein